jgi:hypothetical protein
MSTVRHGSFRFIHSLCNLASPLNLRNLARLFMTQQNQEDAPGVTGAERTMVRINPGLIYQSHDPVAFAFPYGGL